MKSVNAASTFSFLKAVEKDEVMDGLGNLTADSAGTVTWLSFLYERTLQPSSFGHAPVGEQELPVTPTAHARFVAFPQSPSLSLQSLEHHDGNASSGVYAKSSVR